MKVVEQTESPKVTVEKAHEVDPKKTEFENMIEKKQNLESSISQKKELIEKTTKEIAEKDVLLKQTNRWLARYLGLGDALPKVTKPRIMTMDSKNITKKDAKAQKLYDIMKEKGALTVPEIMKIVEENNIKLKTSTIHQYLSRYIEFKRVERGKYEVCDS